MKSLRALSLLLYGLVLMAITANQPSWNFDCLAYAGVAHRYLGHDDARSHQQVYADLAAVAPRDAVDALTRTSSYRSSLAASAERFGAQLPLYRNKPLYTALVALLVGAGVNSVAATFWVSAVAYAGLGVVFMVWMHRVSSAVIAWGIGLCVMLSPPIRELGRLATPDALAALFGLGGVALLWLTRRAVPAAVIFALGIVTRPDSVLICLAAFGWAAWSHVEHRRRAAAGALVGLGTCGLVLIASVPWSVLFRHTFVQRVMSVSEHAGAAVTLHEYSGALGQALRGNQGPRQSVAFLVIACSILAWGVNRRLAASSDANDLRLQVAMWISIVVHVLAFPLLADRFFAAQYLTIVISTVSVVASGVGSRQSTATPRVHG